MGLSVRLCVYCCVHVYSCTHMFTLEYVCISICYTVQFVFVQYIHRFQNTLCALSPLLHHYHIDRTKSMCVYSAYVIMCVYACLSICLCCFTCIFICFFYLILLLASVTYCGIAFHVVMALCSTAVPIVCSGLGDCEEASGGMYCGVCMGVRVVC